MNKHRPFAAAYRLAVFLLAVSTVLAACQNVTPPQPQGTPQPGETAAPAATARPGTRTPAPVLPPTATPTQTEVPEHMLVDPQDLRGLEIVFWHPWSGDTVAVIDAMVAEFNRENVWGVRVTALSTGGGSETYWQVASARAADGGPDVIAAPPDLLHYWDRQQTVADLTDYETNPDWGLSAAEIADFYPVFYEQDRAGGRQIGIPAERDARVLFYNITWARELGFDQPPATTAEFQRQACSAAQALLQDPGRENDGLGGWIVDRDAMTMLSWMAAFGGSPAAETGGELRFNTRQSAEAFAYIRSLFDQGCAWNSRDPLPYDYFATRRALFYAGNLHQIRAQVWAMTRANSSDRWGLVAFPAEDGQPALVASGFSYGILRSTPERQLAAWLFIRHMLLTRNQVRLVEANQSLPVSRSAQAALASFASRNPEWAAALELVPDAVQAARVPGEWWAASGVLEDAAWQMLQITPIPAETILQQADQIVPEMLEHAP